MSGKINVQGNPGVSATGVKVIPTAFWEVQNVIFEPERAGAMIAGAMLAREYDKSRAANAGLMQGIAGMRPPGF